MKSTERPTRSFEQEWKPSRAGGTLPGCAAGGASPSSSANTCNSDPDHDSTRTFLHQLSQTLTALRGTLELALLVDSDAQSYRQVIQQSLLQAETLVQLFKSYRARAYSERARNDSGTPYPRR
jgi:hypothetical protein